MQRYGMGTDKIVGCRESESIKLHSGIRKDSCHTDTERDKKDAEVSKHASSPDKRTAETVFGGRKSG